MIDSIGGPVKVNNMLSTLNIPPIGEKNLKCMERRAGEVVEKVAGMSTLNAAKEAFEMEMQDIAKEESKEAIQSMGAVDEDLGVYPLPDASPSIRQVCSNVFDGMIGDHADHNDELLDDQDWEDVPDEGNPQSPKHPSYLLRLKQRLVNRRSGL